MKWNIQSLLAVGATVFVFGILIMLLFIEIPEENKDLVNTTFATIVGGSIVLAFSYYFGDSDKRS